MMTMKLYYYDNVTPPDYEPPGFQAAAGDDFTFQDDPLNIRVGDVETPFHTVKLRIRTDCQQFSICEEREEQELEEEEEEGSSQELHEGRSQRRSQGQSEEDSQELRPPPTEHMDTDDKGRGQRRAQRPSLPKEAHAATGESQGRAREPSTKLSAKVPDPLPPLHKKDTSTTSVTTPHLPQPMEVEEKAGGRKERRPEREEEEEEEAVEEDNTVRCPCGCNEDDGLMVLCAVCKVWQHAVCFALLSEEDVSETHICVQCSQSDKAHQKCTDPFLQFLNPVTLQATCLWRRALHASVEFNRVVAPMFARRLGVEVSVAQGLINRLEREGFVRLPMKNKRLGKIVNKDRVRNTGMRKYFEKVREEAKTVAKTCPQAKEGVVRDESVEGITNGASCIDISSDPPQQPQVGVVQEEEAEGARRSPRIVAKRVRAAMDQSVEFEISSSQDPDTCDDVNESRRKRRKASIASRSILV